MTEQYRGAPMGRQERGVYKAGMRLRVRRLYLRRGGYDLTGAYWGIGAPVFECSDEARTFLRYRRALSWRAAKEALKAEFPLAHIT